LADFEEATGRHEEPPFFSLSQYPVIFMKRSMRRCPGDARLGMNFAGIELPRHSIALRKLLSRKSGLRVTQS
jgi:hypothetical protein